MKYFFNANMKIEIFFYYDYWAMSKWELQTYVFLLFAKNSYSEFYLNIPISEYE